jgi:hypothetical protein
MWQLGHSSTLQLQDPSSSTLLSIYNLDRCHISVMLHSIRSSSPQFLVWKSHHQMNRVYTRPQTICAGTSKKDCW